jgi:hypothetical protein
MAAPAIPRTYPSARRAAGIVPANFDFDPWGRHPEANRHRRFLCQIKDVGGGPTLARVLARLAMTHAGHGRGAMFQQAGTICQMS